MIEMVKLENEWNNLVQSEDQYVSAMAQSAIISFDFKMNSIYGQTPKIIIRCAAYLDPSVCSVLDKICTSNQRWGTYDQVRIKYMINILIFNCPSDNRNRSN